MADVAVVVCFDVATPAIRCLELPLNEEIGPVTRQIGGVIVGTFGLEQDLAVITGLRGGDVVCMKSHDDSFAPAGFHPVTPVPRGEAVPSSQWVDLGFSVIVGNAAGNVHKRVARTEEPQNEAKQIRLLAHRRGMERI